MLKIRKSQIEALDAYMMKGFEDRIFKRLSVAYPDQYKQLADDENRQRELMALIQDGIRKAQTYGVESERAVGKFIELMLRVAPDFERTREMAWTKGILKDKNLSGHVKMEMIWQEIESET